MVDHEYNIFLHIGLPRTATTFLQQEVFSKIENINFIDGSHPHNNPLKIVFKSIINSENTKSHLLYNYLIEDRLNLISYEGFFGNYFCKEFNSFQNTKNLFEIFPSSKIIFCLREYNSLIKSLYNLYIRKGGTKNFDKFVEKHINQNNFIFNNYVDYLYKLFGKHNVFIYNFEDFNINPIDNIKSICSFMQVDVPSFKNRKVMKSFSDDQLKVIKLLNNLFKTNFNSNGLIPWPFNITVPRLIMEFLFHKKFNIFR